MSSNLREVVKAANRMRENLLEVICELKKEDSLKEDTIQVLRNAFHHDLEIQRGKCKQEYLEELISVQTKLHSRLVEF